MHSASGLDCDDTNRTIAPNQPEKCGDGIDQDCDGRDLPCSGQSDQDGDGWQAGADCADGDPAVYPHAPELCNGKDDDCDGRIDEGNPLALAAGVAPASKTCGQACNGTACACRIGLNICTRFNQSAAEKAMGAPPSIDCFGVGRADKGKFVMGSMTIAMSAWMRG